MYGAYGDPESNGADQGFEQFSAFTEENVRKGKNILLETIPKTSKTASILKWIRARCSSVVRAFAHGAMDCRIDPSWGGPIELFLVPASAPRLV